MREYTFGQPFEPAVREQVIALFGRVYCAYPDDTALLSCDRVRFVAVVGDRLVGHAAFTRRGRYAEITSLAVDPAFRGRGIGATLERARRERVREQGLLGYMSCLCEDAWSQKSKANLGFAPVSIKFGQTYGRVKPGKYSSFLKFTEGEPTPAAIVDEAILTNEHYPSRRVISDRWDTHDDGCYAELLVSPERAARLLDDQRYFYTGIDLDPRRGTWHHCFQLKNVCYYEGVAAEPYLDPRWPARLAAMHHTLEAVLST
ncbi:Acetyltransferase (GNAT) family protein [Actinoplanes cyaneus]|nr:Acetyltransferase (GNAT) family protein [Actinoplanes cyaneus]